MQIQPNIEPLETRAYATVQPYVDHQGTLTIIGTRHNEQIVINRESTGRITAVVKVGKRIVGAAKFKPSQVKRLAINAGGGKDQITIKASGIRSGDIHGGDGNDAIYALGTGLVVSGDAGDDRISVFNNNANGTSSIYGGDGRDRLQTGPGAFLIEGGTGNDILFHASWAPQFDTPIQNSSGDLLVESVMNAFRSEGGEATLYGGEGNDLIYAASNDGIFGGAGRDQLLFDMQTPGLRKTKYVYDTNGTIAEQIGAYDIEVTQIALR